VFAAKAIRTPRSHVPYSYLEEHPETLAVHGLPPGITFQKPGNYSEADKQAILKAASNISFTSIILYSYIFS